MRTRSFVVFILFAMACDKPARPITYSVTISLPDQLRGLAVELWAGDRRLGDSIGPSATFEATGSSRERGRLGEFPTIRAVVSLPCGARDMYTLSTYDTIEEAIDEERVERWRPAVHYTFPPGVSDHGRHLETTLLFLDNRGAAQHRLSVGAVVYAIPAGEAGSLRILRPECQEGVALKLDDHEVGRLTASETSPLLLDSSGERCYRIETIEYSAADVPALPIPDRHLPQSTLHRLERSPDYFLRRPDKSITVSVSDPSRLSASRTVLTDSPCR